MKENMRISWVSEAGLVENISDMVKEYKNARKLQVDVFVLLGNILSRWMNVVLEEESLESTLQSSECSVIVFWKVDNVSTSRIFPQYSGFNLDILG